MLSTVSGGEPSFVISFSHVNINCGQSPLTCTSRHLETVNVVFSGFVFSALLHVDHSEEQWREILNEKNL